MIKIKKANLATITAILTQYWGGNMLVNQGEIYHAEELQGYSAFYRHQLSGCITYVLKENVCHIMTLNSFVEGIGIGTKLADRVLKTARDTKCHLAILTVSNDNLDALKFWQKRGFELKQIHQDAIELARSKKPNIPKYGHYGIPIKHEIELIYHLH